MHRARFCECDVKPVNCEHHQPGSVVGGGICGIGYKEKPSFGVCRHCDRRKPIPGWEGPADGILLVPITARGKTVSTLAVVGPKLWAELHRFAATIAEPIDVAATERWLAEFAKRLPCGDCKTHWKRMIAATPPDFSSREAFFGWTYDRHDEVNVRLGKQSPSRADAWARWSEPAA